MKEKTKMIAIRVPVAGVEALKLLAEKWDVSQGKAVAMLALGERQASMNAPVLPVAPEPIRCDFSPESVLDKDQKRANFDRMKSVLAGGGRLSDLCEQADEIGKVDLNDVPRAPFDVNLEGEPHRVTQFGKRLALCYVGAREPVFNRYLELGEMEKFWGERIK